MNPLLAAVPGLQVVSAANFATRALAVVAFGLVTAAGGAYVAHELTAAKYEKQIAADLAVAIREKELLQQLANTLGARLAKSKRQSNELRQKLSDKVKAYEATPAGRVTCLDAVGVRLYNEALTGVATGGSPAPVPAPAPAVRGDGDVSRPAQ